MDSNGQPTVILFVHGFGSSSECWNPLLKLFQDDPALSSLYEFRTMEYPTAKVNLKAWQRIPRLGELAELLINEMDAMDLRGRRLILVGHSQGGLVIHKAIAKKLLANRAAELTRIRQIILLATPNRGSLFLSPLRRFFSRLTINPQERALRVFNPQIKDLMTIVSAKIVNAQELDSDRCSIPITAIAAAQDAIVTEASAHGSFTNTAVIPGDHFTVLKPDDREDPRYEKLRELLLEPYGHKYVFEIERYETEITITPQPKLVNRTVKHGTKERVVETRSEATILRKVQFGPRNQCHQPFIIRYGTRCGGYIRPTISGAENVAPGADICRYDDYGVEYTYAFYPNPQSDRSYSLRVEVLKGFDDKNQDVHFHLGRHSYYKRLTYKVDLSGYMNGEWDIVAPSLFLHREDSGHGELCGHRDHLSAETPVNADVEGGIWAWEIEHLREGVVDIIWEAVRI